MNELFIQFLEANNLSICDLRDYCNHVGQEISIIWSIDDVHKANQGTGHRLLSDDEALLILSRVECGHDRNYGISWETIIWHIEDYFEDQ